MNQVKYTLKSNPESGDGSVTHRNIARQALDYNPQGKRKSGRPKSNWRRSMLDELTKTVTSWQEAKTIAQRSEVESWWTPYAPMGAKRIKEEYITRILF